MKHNLSPALFAKRSKVTHGAIKHRLDHGFLNHDRKRVFFTTTISKETGKRHIVLDKIAVEYMERHAAKR